LAPPNVGDTADIGAFERQLVEANPATVTNVVINNGAAQRSQVTSIKVTFDKIVQFVGSPAAAFTLTQQGTNAPVNLAASVDNSGPGTVVTLTFTGGAVAPGNSLANGKYTLIIDPNQIQNQGGSIDGTFDSVAGGNYVLVGSTAPPGLFRYYGDSNGDGVVNSVDFVAFRTAFGTGPSIFDFNNDGQTNSTDFVEFRRVFGTSVP
jgi:hypothetical protein